MTDTTHPIVSDFVKFLNKSCSAFHAVDASKQMLLEAGFRQLLETEIWAVEKGKSYFFIRNGTTIMAFTVGGKYISENGYTCIGAHTDSPCLKVKPVPCSKKLDSLVLNTQPYGGGLWHTWFDRDLGLAGRIILRDSDSSVLYSKLISIQKPIVRIPNLAIHLTSGSEREHFAPNLQEHAKAIITMDFDLVGLKHEESPSASDSESHQSSNKKAKTSRFHPLLLQMVAKELNLDGNKNEIVDMELQLIDIQPSVLGGGISGESEFVISGRLDNLCSAYQSLKALIDTSSETQSQGANVCMAMLFDHEEIGSSSCVGAGSSLFMDTLKLIHQSLASNNNDTHGGLMRSLRKSLVVSADMAHGHHPNYAAKHDSDHAPKIHSGLVVKHNANQRYATNAVSASVFRELARLGDESVQEFAVKSDSGCGSTIGPILATLSGILTVDVGSPQFSMHSIREMMGAKDVVSGYKVFKSVYLNHHIIASNSKIL